jgi:hypothetical protein
MDLNELVRKYLEKSGAFDRPVELASLGLSREETEKTFSAFDEDYHISRFFHFANAAGEKLQAGYQINGFPQTHVSIDAEIQSIL